MENVNVAGKLLTCRCGRSWEEKIQDAHLSYSGFDFTILNLPHAYCERCKTQLFQIDTGASKALKYAVNNRLAVVDWNEMK